MAFVIGERLRTDVENAQEEYTLTNVTEDRTMDADAAAVTEVADVLATLIQDLADLGIVDVA